MIDKEIITKNEAENNGQTIHIFYDDIAGLYMAFGLSAYYTTMVTDPYMSYSEAFQMPVGITVLRCVRKWERLVMSVGPLVF